MCLIYTNLTKIFPCIFHIKTLVKLFIKNSTEVISAPIFLIYIIFKGRIKVGLYSGYDSDATDLRFRFQHRYPIAVTTHVI
jgi:hypothetical protein